MNGEVNDAGVFPASLYTMTLHGVTEMVCVLHAFSVVEEGKREKFN